MTRGLPTIFTTRAGRDLGEKIVWELSDILHTRAHAIVDKVPSTMREEEQKRIQAIREYNRYLFGDKWGRFHLRHASVKNFSDGEIHFTLPDYVLGQERGTIQVVKGVAQTGKKVIKNTVRQQDVYLVDAPLQPKEPVEDILARLPQRVPRKRVENLLRHERSLKDVHHNIFETLLIAYTLGRWAERVTLVSPYHLYARQDHARTREEVTAKLLAKMFEAARVSHGIYMDLHSDQIPAFYEHRPENLRASARLEEVIVEEMGMTDDNRDDYVVVTPDAGGTARARHYSKRLDAGIGIGDKRRGYDEDNYVETVEIIGDVNKKKVLVIDDMIDTAGTIVKTVEAALRQGAKEVWVACTHAVFSGPAVGRLDELYRDGKLKKVIVTDSITRGAEFAREHEWYLEAQTTNLLARTVYTLNAGHSVSDVYEGSGELDIVRFDKAA
ncbi:ribose-phosphate diphosphokinase [Nanoarchaeota archaeon]